MRAKISHVIIHRRGIKEEVMEHLELFKHNSSEELIETYNRNVQIGSIAVYAQAIMLVALRRVIKERFGVSPITIEDNMIVSLTGKVMIKDGKLFYTSDGQEVF